MKLGDLFWLLDSFSPDERRPEDFNFKNIVVYHVTAPSKVESIRERGLSALPCRQSYVRPDAVYFFADHDEITPEQVDILGLSSGCKIIKVAIPVDKVIKYMYWDGLYNVSFYTTSAVQYRADVPPEWIISIEDYETPQR
jgi:hypothetical protein